MSTAYQMKIILEKVKEEEEELLKEVVDKEWSVDNCWFEDGHLYFVGEGSLYGGEGEEEFVDRISKALWLKLDRYVPIYVKAIYLENPPYEEYNKDEEDYAKLFPNSIRLAQDLQEKCDEDDKEIDIPF